MSQSRVALGERRQVGVGIVVSPRIAACTLGFLPVEKRVSFLHLQVGNIGKVEILLVLAYNVLLNQFLGTEIRQHTHCSARTTSGPSFMNHHFLGYRDISEGRSGSVRDCCGFSQLWNSQSEMELSG